MSRLTNNLPITCIVPVKFVDYYRADYGEGFQFYFVFLRERRLDSTVSLR